jgi:dinuclear metal center YbgI/SA1388 family protein
MDGARVTEIAEYLDSFLRVAEVLDYSNALNGLQVESSGEVGRIGAAVDASQRTIEEAVRRGCDFLLVHHGLFWDGNLPVTGRRYRKLKQLLESNVAVYASHLPLDLHPEVGNSAVLARAMGVRIEGTFGDYRGVDLGVWGILELSREALAARLDDLLGGPVRLVPGGGQKVQRVGVLTGGGGDLIKHAIRAELDAYVTGEGAHHTYFDAMEGGINVYYGGHYATETWGVRALAEHVAERFGVEWEFIDLPTGL